MCSVILLSGSSELWFSDVGSLNTFLQRIINGLPNWLTKFHYVISIHNCFHSKENGNCTILHYICSDKFFGAFSYPILLHIATNQSIVFVILMGIRFSSSCVFIFCIVFSFSFCLLQMFVICGNYLIGKTKQKYST